MNRRICTAAIALVLAIGFVPAAAPVQGSVGSKIYWSDGNHGGTAAAKISRSNFDGSSPEALVVPAALSVRFIALDPPGGKVYWIESAAIRRADINGGPEEAFIAALPGPSGMALDATGRFVYWTDTATRAIHRASLDDPSVRIQLTVTGQPRELALDVAAGKIYWVEGGTIRRANLDLDVASVENAVLAVGSLVKGLALDPSGGKVYWTDVGVVGVDFVGRVRRANLLDGSGVETVVVVPSNSMLVEPRGIAVDSGGGNMYWAVFWTDATGTPTGGRIQRADLAGTVVQDTVTGLDTPWGVALHAAVQFVRRVGIDIKPGGDMSSINPGSHGVIPVAILSEPGFDAPAEVDVNPMSLTFGRTGTESSLASCSASPQDVNKDGLADLMCHFYTDQTGFQPGDTQGVLKGKTLDGQDLDGVDAVRVI